MPAELEIAVTKQAIWKLAHFEPYFSDTYGNQALDYLVLDALAAYGPLLSITPKQIQDHIKTVFLLTFDQAEIISAVGRMIPKNYATTTNQDKHSPPCFSIVPELHEKISKNLISIKEQEQEILDEWKDELIASYKSHPSVEKNIQVILNGLQAFLSAIMIRHGVECVNLLYPDNDKVTSWLDSVKQEVFESISRTDGFIDTIVRLEIPRFFLKSDEKRKKYIFRVFNSSFFWHLIQVDENCSKLFREVTAGQQLYLDNNVIYSLVGFHGPYVLESTHNMLKLANELGYELCVTTKTIEEFHESLLWRMKEYKTRPPIPAELANIAVRNLEESSFITAYWKELAKNGITIEEFVSEKSHLEDVFKGINIRTIDEFREDIEKSKDLETEINILRQVAAPWTSEHVLNHDAFHRLFIQKLRQGQIYNFKDAVAWFLTTDSKLPAYDKVARKGNNCLPFCLTTDHWIQINRPLIARTSNREEYEKSFYNLVTQPFLRSMMPQKNLERAHQEVLSRLARYKVMTSQLAFDIVANRHFMLSVASEDEPQKIDEKLEHEFLDIAIEYQRKTESLEVSNANLQIELQEQIAALYREVTEQGESILLMKSERDEIENDKKSLEKKRRRLEEENTTLKIKIRWIIFFILIIPISYLIWSSNIFGKWVLDGKGMIIAKLLAQSIITSILLLIPLWKYKKLLISTIVVGVLLKVLDLLPEILK